MPLPMITQKTSGRTSERQNSNANTSLVGHKGTKEYLIYFLVFISVALKTCEPSSSMGASSQTVTTAVAGLQSTQDNSHTSIYSIDNSERFYSLVGDVSDSIRRKPVGSRIVLKRSPAQSHCARPHDYKRLKATTDALAPLQLDITQLNMLIKVEPISQYKSYAGNSRASHDRSSAGSRGMDSSSSNSSGRIGGTDVEGSMVVAHVGAMMSMEQLVDALLPMGYVPAVVPEFKGITVGGSIQGLAAESTSFRFGLFHEAVLQFEALLEDGSLITCSPDEHADLFYGLPGSFGTLAVCVSAKILCIPATSQVKVSARRHRCHRDCVQELNSIMIDAPTSAVENVGATATASIKYGPDFVEAIGFSSNDYLRISASFYTAPTQAAVDATVEAAVVVPAVPIRRCLGWGAPWFYKLVHREARKQQYPQSGEQRDAEFLLPTKDYLFRHDRGSFWMASYRIPEIIGRFIDPLLDSSNMFRLATALPWAFPKSAIVLQDFMLPMDRVDAFVDSMQQLLDVWPIWLLPMRNNFQATAAASASAGSNSSCLDSNSSCRSKNSKNNIISGSSAIENCTSKKKQEQRAIFSVANTAAAHYCNVGAYGIPRLRYFFEPANRWLEALLFAHRGRKVHYSHAFYERDFFYERLYDGDRYFQLRKKFCCAGSFPEIHEKIVVKNSRL